MLCENDDTWLMHGGQPALSKEPATDPGGHAGRATTQPVPLWTPAWTVPRPGRSGGGQHGPVTQRLAGTRAGSDPGTENRLEQSSALGLRSLGFLRASLPIQPKGQVLRGVLSQVGCLALCAQGAHTHVLQGGLRHLQRF